MVDTEQPTSEFDRIDTGGSDAQKRIIVEVYALRRGTYAVYSTSNRVIVLFADDPLLQSQQRKQLAPLASVRSEIDGAIGPWRRSSPLWRLRDAAAQVDLLVAFALVEALEGSVESAAATLEWIRADVAGERASRARLYYLACTICVAAALLVVALVALGAIPTRHAVTEESSRSVWMAVATGVLGAVYSIVLGIEKRDVTNDRRWVDHVTDATVRICVGSLAAFVLVVFLMSGVIQINFGQGHGVGLGGAAVGPDGETRLAWPVTLICGFLAGFVERLVPDLLNSYAVGPVRASRDPATPAPVGATRDQPERKPPGDDGGAETLDPEEHVDGCDVDLSAADGLTVDDHLPAASGGVARR